MSRPHSMPNLIVELSPVKEQGLNKFGTKGLVWFGKHRISSTGSQSASLVRKVSLNLANVDRVTMH